MYIPFKNNLCSLSIAPSRCSCTTSAHSFGEVEKVEESAVTVLWDRVQEEAESCTIDHCQQRFPTYTNDVACVCRNMAERALQVSHLVYTL